MNVLSRIITGGAMIVIGLVLFVIGFFDLFFLWLYGIPLLIIGLFIFFNKKEDKIEQIKKKK